MRVRNWGTPYLRGEGHSQLELKEFSVRAEVLVTKDEMGRTRRR